MSGQAKLPYGTLILGADAIKESIANFDDALGLFFSVVAFPLLTPLS